MPCQVFESEEEVEEQQRAYFRHNSDVAEMLCALCKYLEASSANGVPALTGLREWWAEHKVRDKEKAEREVAEAVVKEKTNLAKYEKLSSREKEVMSMIVRGMKPQEIASALHVSVKTISTYRGRIMDKMRMRSGAELAIYAFRNGLIT